MIRRQTGWTSVVLSIESIARTIIHDRNAIETEAEADSLTLFIFFLLFLCCACLLVHVCVVLCCVVSSTKVPVPFVGVWPDDEPINAHSHLIAMLLGQSDSVPVHEGKLVLG